MMNLRFSYLLGLVFIGLCGQVAYSLPCYVALTADTQTYTTLENFLIEKDEGEFPTVVSYPIPSLSADIDEVVRSLATVLPADAESRRHFVESTFSKEFAFHIKYTGSNITFAGVLLHELAKYDLLADRTPSGEFVLLVGLFRLVPYEAAFGASGGVTSSSSENSPSASNIPRTLRDEVTAILDGETFQFPLNHRSPSVIRLLEIMTAGVSPHPEARARSIFQSYGLSFSIDLDMHDTGEGFPRRLLYHLSLHGLLNQRDSSGEFTLLSLLRDPIL